MTIGSTYWQRHEVQLARDTVLRVMPASANVPHHQLQQMSMLSDRRFDRAVADLLQEQQLVRHMQPDAEPTYALPRTDDTALPEPALHEADAILAFLRAAPNTAQQVARAVNLEEDDVHRLLALLARHGLVTFRYVGRLNIYRAT